VTGHKPQEAEQEPKLPLPPTPSRKGRGGFGSSSPSSSHPFPLAFSPSLLRLLSPRTHRLLGSIAIYAGYIVVSTIFLFPLLWVASLSLRPMAELFAFPPHLIPQHPTLAAYRDVLIGSPLALYLLNSVKLVSATVLCALAIAIPSAYALSRLRFRQPALKSLVMLGMLAVQLISPLVTALPLYRWFSALGLINSHAALILVYVALSAPFATWMLTGFLDAVPVALDEAARIDGCTRLQSLLRVLLPVMLPGLASTAILLAISTWGQFIVPFVLLTRGDLYPVSVGILDYQSSSDSVSTHLLAAAAILSALPAMLTFIVLQRFIVGALTAGAVKG
jgi:multiple sugar transport system permease protein